MVMEEFEVKFLEVNVPELEKKLLEIGARKTSEYEYSRAIFDYQDLRMDKEGGWVRLRTDGKESTLTYKKRIGIKSNDGSVADDGMQEIEVIIDSYEKTHQLLKAIGLVVKIESKNKRVRYEKGDVTFDIDSWPQIPPYLEVESSSLEKVKNAANELGFDGKKGIICSAKQIYKKYRIDVDDYSSITFEGMTKK